ncbi:branched-chain amino acid ABC transporter permease [Ruegeria lacuscaerulensis]|uniref:branched-chain amino acid ABC transporter permease n=1 Tax=Ruegeria lacuscaerulensis TaxID=55218 RepID=UPI00147E0C5F|nr:branched-chain amino acid ABC transporter permease [Ruegeria lacuscaerulensis]
MTVLRSDLAFFAGLAILAGFGLSVGSLFGTYWVIVALNFAMWIALTQSWALFSGLTGYISLGNVVFYGLGAYTVAVSFKVLPLWVAVPMGGLVAAVFALMIAVPALRVRGPYFVILTFGISELVKYSILNLETYLGKSSRLLFGAPSAEAVLYTMIALAVASSVLMRLVKSSTFGRGLVAIQGDETSAETVGIPVTRFKVMGFTLSAFIPGMVGGLMALRSTYFEVLQVFNPFISFTIVTMAIIGGSNDARGPILGAAFLVFLSELLWSSAPRLYMILLGAFLIAFVLLAPSGLVGLLRKYGEGHSK